MNRVSFPFLLLFLLLSARFSVTSSQPFFLKKSIGTAEIHPINSSFCSFSSIPDLQRWCTYKKQRSHSEMRRENFIFAQVLDSFLLPVVPLLIFWFSFLRKRNPRKENKPKKPPRDRKRTKHLKQNLKSVIPMVEFPPPGYLPSLSVMFETSFGFHLFPPPRAFCAARVRAFAKNTLPVEVLGTWGSGRIIFSPYWLLLRLKVEISVKKPLLLPVPGSLFNCAK